MKKIRWRHYPKLDYGVYETYLILPIVGELCITLAKDVNDEWSVDIDAYEYWDDSIMPYSYDGVKTLEKAKELAFNEIKKECGKIIKNIEKESQKLKKTLKALK